MQQELESCSDYILSLEEKVYKANKTMLSLLQQLKESEQEAEGLYELVSEMKQNISVYVPVRKDAIDKRLAEFINNYPDKHKLKVLFMRESEGIYSFRSKRVAIRVEQEKINIRVGGGYLSIDEFLEQYTPIEVQKMERKDPFKKANERQLIQKVIRQRDTSPKRNKSLTHLYNDKSLQSVKN